MCEPTTILAITGATAVGTGTILSARGQYQTDKSNERVLEFKEKTTLQQSDANAAVLDAQAREEDFKAKESIKRGKFVVNRYRRKIQGEIGETKAKLAVTGVEIGTGSAQRVLDDQARSGAMDMIILEQNNALETWGYRSRAEKFRAGAGITRQYGKVQARLFGAQGKAVGKAANVRFTTSLLSGFGQMVLLSAGALGSGGGGGGGGGVKKRGGGPDKLPSKT